MIDCQIYRKKCWCVCEKNEDKLYIVTQMPTRLHENILRTCELWGHGWRGREAFLGTKKCLWPSPSCMKVDPKVEGRVGYAPAMGIKGVCVCLIFYFTTFIKIINNFKITLYTSLWLNLLNLETPKNLFYTVEYILFFSYKISLQG